MSVIKIEEPINQFREWYAAAQKAEPDYPDAASLATATSEGRPSARMVLVKAVDERGFVFYTNLQSRKGGELADNPFAALCFHWKSQKRQVRIEGPVEAVDVAEADAYFASRPRMSQIGAWASKQSQPLTGRMQLEKRIAEYTAKFHVGAVPRPEFWSGFRIVPDRIEFWEEVTFRLHERLVYHRTADGWRTERLFP
ncbi:MAG: pyridoxamine 5'-phosphate oxidase [Rhodospirillales bacterium]|nr:pyridoxamine 5'-phosphate oxidase [Rhodospirillales bacterium]MCW8861978.1 pyridoxamine 5'-phosphate oxidase [Rhodospirillales bacterium]MCW8951180.1 pyridoxamine 5'-phosphate oxidase [Rhodospirillales bacterium]MCW8970575.1 pyridoxamine 5'-phosphate oxidase [Rhodospirillales bacterium]MCW9003253.1 pyridoxamine 5'-phosphate oxidase [Rhodospirillales bacterium]